MRGGGGHGGGRGWRGAGGRFWRRPRGPWAWGLRRWQWGGAPALWSVLDLDRDDRVTVDEMLDALGPRGLELLMGEAGDPIARGSWNGDGRAFDALDANGDGYVDRRDVERGLGGAATRLLVGGEPPGPELPPGARYEERGGGLWVVFPGREAKAAYMAEAAGRDASDPAVVSWAQQFMKLPLGQRAGAILRFCQLAVRYQRDPGWYDRAGHRHGIEVLESAAVVLFRGYGDCDAKTRLFLALCKACGVSARLAPVFRGADGFPHVRAEVLDEETGRWLVADASIVNSSLGHLPAHIRTHMLQRRLTAHGWEVSDDDGTTWHPMEGEAGDGEEPPDEAAPGEDLQQDDELGDDELGDTMPYDTAPGGATPGGATPGGATPGGVMPGGAMMAARPPKPVVRISRRFRYRPGAVITTAGRGGKLTRRWRVGRDGVTLTALGPAMRATPESLMAATADRRAAKRIRGASNGRPGEGPYEPGAIVYVGGFWYQIDPHGRATPEGVLPNQPPPPPPDQVAAQLAAARRTPSPPPPRRAARSRGGQPGSMLPSQVSKISSTIPQVISAVGRGISGVTSAVQSIAGAFSGFGGGVGEAGRGSTSETPIPGISAIISALGSTAFRLEDFVAQSEGRVQPTPEHAGAWLRAFRIDPGLLFAASHASVEAAARLVRYLKLASGEQPMQPAWEIGANPYLARVDPTDPLTDPAYLQGIRDAIVGTSDARAAIEHLAVEPVVVNRETARRMLALLRHDLVANGLPHWADVRACLGEIASEIQRVRQIAGEQGADPHLSWLFGDVSVPAASSAA